MNKVVNWLKIALPFLTMGQSILQDLDDNDTGKDDDAAHFLNYVIAGLTAIIAGKPTPKAPKSLQ